jgi:hypothetical protein
MGASLCLPRSSLVNEGDLRSLKSSAMTLACRLKTSPCLTYSTPVKKPFSSPAPRKVSLIRI